jgi:tetratricopeptide (TPR) repeat protein
MTDELAGADRGSTPPSFDFDDDAIASLLDTFVETQTGPQNKHVSHPPDPDDAGAQAAQRTVFEDGFRHSTLPLVGDSTGTKSRRIQLLDALAERSAGSSKARLLTSAAELCEQLGDTDGAVERYEAAQRADVRDVIVLRALRRQAIRREHWADAVQALEREAALDIASAERVAGLKLLAQIHLARLGDAAAAEQAALHAAEIDPSDFVAWLIAAGARLARGREASAARALAEAAERWPYADAQAVIYLHAAQLLEKAGEVTESRMMYERLLESRPEILAGRLGMARTAAAVGDREAASNALIDAAQAAPPSVAHALRRAAAVMTGAAELRRELLVGAPEASSLWTLTQSAALDGDLRAAADALTMRPTDQTRELEGLFAALRARYHAELGAAPVGGERVHPALHPYTDAWRELGEVDAEASWPQASVADLPDALACECEQAADRTLPGWALATAEVGKPAERLRVLLDTEASNPGDRWVRHALLLSDPDETRHAERCGRESESLAASKGAEYPPNQWSLLDANPSLDAASTTLDRQRPDPLLIEHLVASADSQSEEAGRLLLLAAQKLGGQGYRRRAAEAFLAAGAPGEAARVLREACGISPNDLTLRTRRKDAELRASEFARVVDSGMERARDAPDELERLQALAAMAEVDRLARRDMQSARLSLQSVAEVRPDHIPTARALEWDALRERDAERIRSSARLLLAALPEATSERVARWRLIVELLRADPDILQNDLDLVLRGIDEPNEADPGLARQVLGAAYAKGETELALEALIVLQAALGDELERAALALEAADLLRRAAQPGRALEALNTAGNHPLALEAEAQLLRASKRWLDAAGTYEEAASRAKDPQRAAALWREAACIFEEELDDRSQARSAWVAAVHADITYLDVYRRLGALYQAEGSTDELAALTEARIEAGADNPTLVALLLEQAGQREARGDLDGALESLGECLDLDPQHFAALQRLVETHRSRDNWQGAAEGLIRIARLKRNTGEQVLAFSQLAEIYHEHLGDLSRAEASLRRALELAPTHTEALDRLASVLTRQDRADEAARLLQVLVERERDDTRRRDYRIRLSSALELAGDPRRAESTLETLRAELPTDPDVILAMADYYVRQGAGPAEAMHLNRAANDLREAIEARPGDEGLWSTLARVLARRHGPGAASCAAGAAIAIGHAPALFEGAVGNRGESIGDAKLPLSPVIDRIVAPPSLPPTVRRLFALCEHAFDKMLPFDNAAWRLKRPSGPHRMLVDEAGAVAEALGISEPRLRITQIAPAACMPITGDPPTLVVGAGLHELTTPEERFFLFARALKVAASHMAPALRARPEELDAALLALLHGHDPSRPEGPEPQQLQELRRKLIRAVPRRWRDEVESLVLELSSQPEFSTRLVPFTVSSLGDRVALVLTGDIPSGIDALLKIAGHAVPSDHGARLQTIRETPEALALLRFSISDAHFEARTQAGVDR